MPYETIENKKFIDGAGAGYLWSKIKNRYDSKLDEVRAADESINVSNNNQIQVMISAESGNMLQLRTTGNKGLYVSGSGGGSGGGPADTYTIVRDDTNTEYAAVYHLRKFTNGTGNGEDVGAAITIAKDMVVESGAVVTKSSSGEWGAAGTYIELVLANSGNSKLYIPVGSLIEYVTSGSYPTDAVVINVNPSTHQVTASLTDGKITIGKLDSNLQNMIANAAAGIRTVSEGFTNGTINVDGTDVAVHGLGTAAFFAATSFDGAGAASSVLGTTSDTAATGTVYGVKKYASDAYAAILPLSTQEIDQAIAAVENA